MKGSLHFNMKMLLLLVVVVAAAAAADNQDVKSMDYQKEFDKTIVAENDPSFLFGGLMALVSGKAYDVKNLISGQFTYTDYKQEKMAKQSLGSDKAGKVSETKFNENIGKEVFEDDTSDIHGRLDTAENQKAGDVKNIHGDLKTKTNENIGNGVYEHDKPLPEEKNAAPAGRKIRLVNLLKQGSRVEKNIANSGRRLVGSSEKSIRGASLRAIASGKEKETKYNENIGNGVFEHDGPLPVKRGNPSGIGKIGPSGLGKIRPSGREGQSIVGPSGVVIKPGQEKMIGPNIKQKIEKKRKI